MNEVEAAAIASLREEDARLRAELAKAQEALRAAQIGIRHIEAELAEARVEIEQYRKLTKLGVAEVKRLIAKPCPGCVAAGKLLGPHAAWAVEDWHAAREDWRREWLGEGDE